MRLISGTGILALLLCFTGSALAARIEFNRDIKPIMADTCFACHGFDEKSRKAELRLDLREEALKPAKSGAIPIVPGKPEESEFIKRLFTKDEDDLMPPPKSHKTITPEQKEKFRQWIAEGAEYQGHWAFIKPTRASEPAVRNKRWVRNPIDAFILARLEEKKLKPAPEADRYRLARRLALDLTGLPPTPEMTAAFVKDRSKDAYEHYVDRLMAMPQWGEHRGRYWLDAARYADTHGYHFDNYREIWPYRDWVIKAFNNNLPFDKFTLEQIAGDLLPNPTEDQLIATGFHRCGMTTNEGGTIDEENLAIYANERVTTTSWVWLGLTANCAACHNHKFDPITTKDFYSMEAFFRNTTQGAKDGNVRDSQPSMLIPQTDADERLSKDLPPKLAAARSAVARDRKAVEIGFSDWIKEQTTNTFTKALNAEGLVLHAPLDAKSTNKITATVSGKNVTLPTKGDMSVTTDKRIGSGLSFGERGTIEFPDAGNFEADQPFSFGGWVYIPRNSTEAVALMSRMEDGTIKRGWDLWFESALFVVHIADDWPSGGMKVKTRIRLARAGSWQHVFVTYDGSRKPEGISIYVNGDEAEMEMDRGTGVVGSIKTKAPFKLAQRNSTAHFDGLGLQDIRIYSRELSGAEVGLMARRPEFATLLKGPQDKWKAPDRDALLKFYLETQPSYKAVARKLDSLERVNNGLKLRNPVAHIQMEKKDAQPMAFVLFRGEYDKKRDQVSADTFKTLHAFPEAAPRNRLGLAEWILSPENPLTARVTVNRFWQEIFGTGIVRTAEDFGTMGDAPSNQALLDWLAVEFVESGWNVKHLFKLIVMSSAYRQSEDVSKAALEIDPDNRLISRGPRFRMDAEMVRDHALAASGLLDRKIGGASVKPYQPPGVWEAVAMPESNTRFYRQDTGQALYRRSMYTFWKRAAPPASMDIMNAPNRETCTVRRERTNTPLQALVTLNDPQFIEAARHLAEISLAKSSRSSAALDDMAFRLLARPVKRTEERVIKSSLAEFERYFEAHPDEASALLSVGESKPDPSIPAPRLAAMTMLANQLLNLDEVLNK